MLSAFSSISPHLKFKTKVISIDNLAFKCHYRASFLALLVCTVLVTSRQYIGEHIKCIAGGGVPEHVINTFCFFTTTFTVIRHYNESLLQDEVLPHPGVGPMFLEDPIKHHAYYQWVPFVLFGQAILFYLSHLLWRSWEGGKIQKLVIGLQMVDLSRNYQKKENLVVGDVTIMARSVLSGRISNIKRAFHQHITVNRNWANKLLLCEVLNLVNVILQIVFTNWFLGGEFYTLGVNFIKDDFKGIMDTLDTVFPKVTKCLFYKYGPSGSIQKHDALCVMALNVINEKIYVFLWFWFLFLIVVSAAALIWRFITMCLHSRSTKFNSIVYSYTCPGRLNPWDMLEVTNRFAFSDWLFLYYLAVNMDPYLFRNFLIEIASELRDKKAMVVRDADSSDSDNEKGHDSLLHEDDSNIKANIDSVDGKHVKFT